MQKIPLPSNWTVRAVSNLQEVPPELHNRDIPAVVPGSVHLDLERENLIPDPYLDQNETLVQWVGRTDWEYRTTFSVSDEALQEERVDLVCEGLDTVATIWVNGIEVGGSENMHVEARFSIKSVLREGDNEIRARFDSPVFYARAMRDKLGDLPHANSYPNCEPFHFIRKNASNFGWDWGPALTTSGIWKAIRLEAWSVARIKSVRPLVKVANEKVAVVDVYVDVEHISVEPLHGEWLIATINESNRAMAKMDEFGKATLSLYVQNPELWWPRGYGEQPLYHLKVAVVGDPDEHESVNCKIGLREVELDTSPDDIGAKWALKVNGREIWCKGANWIPDDVFLTRASEPERLRERLQQACEANVNYLLDKLRGLSFQFSNRFERTTVGQLTPLVRRLRIAPESGPLRTKCNTPFSCTGPHGPPVTRSMVVGFATQSYSATYKVGKPLLFFKSALLRRRNNAIP